MNIFILSEDPRLAAQYQCNKHIVKMTCESAQIVCTAMLITGRATEQCLPYRGTHKKHPCVLWAAKCDENLMWLFAHGVELGAEYKRRYGRKHMSANALENIRWLVPRADLTKHTPFVQCMPDTYKQNDPVEAYRAYYIGEKRRFAKWQPRANTPFWWPNK